MGCKLVAYRRVSTAKQGQSGLGLEAQDAAILAYAAATGCELIATYDEVETGKRSDRPELAKAMAHAKRSKATLVIAKLDRLSRNVHFLSGLMESKVPFVACDNPHATPLTIHILAAVAEDEAKRTSERTKAALGAFKAGMRLSKRRTEILNERYHGNIPQAEIDAVAGKLGATLVGSHLTAAARAKGQKMGNAKQVAMAREAYSDLLPRIQGLKAGGATLATIAETLNREGHSTQKGTPWRATQVKRVLDREATR